MIPDTVIVLAKSPRPGRVKTRLQPTFTAVQAAALAAAAIRDTLDAVARLSPRRTVIAWDGPAVSWLPPHAVVVPQSGTGLDERLEHAFAQAFATDARSHAERGHEEGERPTVLIGMDTPQITPADLDVDWGGRDAVLGPSHDGGYWVIGFRRQVHGALVGVPMSTPGTGDAQLMRLTALGLDVMVLPMLRDVDQAADAAAVAAAAPDSRFGRLHRRLVD